MGVWRLLSSGLNVHLTNILRFHVPTKNTDGVLKYSCDSNIRPWGMRLTATKAEFAIGGGIH